MKCDRCHKETPANKYYCVNCNHRNPHLPESHYRGVDWNCPSCGAENGGGFLRCARCNTVNPA